MDYIFDANKKVFDRARQKENVVKAMDDCRSLFWVSIAPIHFIAHQEFLKVYDYYEDNNLMKFNIKKLLTDVDKEFAKFDEYVHESYTQDAIAVPYDLCNQVAGGLEKEILDLFLTFKFHMERNGIKDVEIKAQIQTAKAMFDCWRNLSDMFFNKYKKENYINFRKYYYFADLTKADSIFNRFYNFVVKPERYKDFEPTKNYSSIKAYEAFVSKLVDANFLDDKSIVALSLNNCVEELAEIYGGGNGMVGNAKIIRKKS